MKCDVRMPFTIEGSNDGQSWTVLLTVENLESYSGILTKLPNDIDIWEFNNTTAYLYYCMSITKNKSSKVVVIRALDFLRR